MMETNWPFGAHMVGFKVLAGVSNRNSDLDNLLKPFFDTFQSVFTVDGKKQFNDNKVYHIEMRKEIVPKGEEFIEVTVRKMDEDE